MKLFATIVLGTGAALLWADRLLFYPAPRKIDLDTFERAARATWPDEELRLAPFAPSPLIPEQHLHLMPTGPMAEGELFSIYLGHYPVLTDAGDSKPHDPGLCYSIGGYEILEGPVTLRIDSGGHQHALQRIVVGGRLADGTPQTFTAFYWSQFAGRHPEAHPGLPGALTRTELRYDARRADLAWVRVEFAGTERELDGELAGRFETLMRAAAAAMR